MSLHTDIAQAVADTIREEFPDLLVERAYVPVIELKQPDETKVLVVPREIGREKTTRSQNKFEVLIDVAVLHKFESPDPSVIDPLTDLVERIGAKFDGFRLPLGDGAVCTKVQNKPIFAPDHFERLHQFTSLLTLHFSVFKLIGT